MECCQGKPCQGGGGQAKPWRWPCGCVRMASAEALRRGTRQLEQGKEGAWEEISGTKGQHSSNINHFKCMNCQSYLSTAQFPKGHTIKNLFICSRTPVLLATVRSDNEHTCRRFFARDVTGFCHCLQEDLVCDQRKQMTWSHRPSP